MNIIPQNTTDRIEFNFTCYALKLLGHNLYSNPWTAVSEIVANGIDAKAKNIYILVDLFNKESAQIEVIDDGYGMTYQDLCDKYTIIGRNKRIDNPEDKSILGRKGVGKLAALYLSDKYYLFTKSKSETSSWQVDLSNAKDNDVPALERCDDEQIINSFEIWNNLTSGTLVKLTNVDLKKVGPERLKALPVILSDYYLSDVIDCKISVCVRYYKHQTIKFTPIQKHISYKTMYEIFDNTGNGYLDRIKDTVFLNRVFELPNELDKPVPTIKMDSFDDTEGSIEVKNLYGETIIAQYMLKGWIGIHGSLNPEIQRRNDPEYGKVQYHPNAIRLYVRGKLAVDNLLTYVKNTQAFANYIEGEISFDILDDDRFEDISTSNREGYKKDDIRVVTLLNIVGKIVQKLVGDRSTVGTRINNELKEYWEAKRREEEKKKQEEAEARVKAERAKEEAEKKQKEAEAEAKKYHAQSATIFNTVTEDQKSFSAKTHLVKTNALTIRNSVTTLAKKIGISSYRELSSISIASDKILSALKYSALAKFNIEDEFITEDLFVFCKEYLLNVLAKQYYDINILTDIRGAFHKRFRPQYISLLLDNLLSNSEKSNSTEILVEMKSEKDKYSIVISDNGDGFGDIDMDRVFEFGFSNTGGTGIGLYNVKTVIEKMNGQIIAEPNKPKGAKFIISLQ